MRWALVLVALGACYDAPTGPAACTITCTTDCPGDLTCKGGYCVSGNDLCAPEFQQISTGGGYACAVDAIHDLWCWGDNAHHQIAPTGEVAFPLAHHVGTRKYEMITTGRAHTCGISEGELVCWGANEHGQISASILGDVVDPTPIVVTGGPSTWKYVSASFSTTCAIGDDGRLFCWGEGRNGQLGNGGTADIGAPTPVTTAIADWTTVVQGGGLDAQHTCALSAAAGLFCWGSDAYNELGDGLSAETRVPGTTALALPDVTSVAAAGYSTCAVSAGDLYCWGYAPDGALGDPLVIDPNVGHPTPTLGSSVHGWTAVTGNGEMVCGIAGGDVYCWGLSVAGNGFGDAVWHPGERLFTKVASDATAISMGFNEYVDDAMPPNQALDMDNVCYLGGGAVRCWGDDRFGQLGQGAPTETAVPLEVAGEHSWTALSTGRDHACGVDDAGLVHCWGSTLEGAVDGSIAGTLAAPCADPELCDPGKPREVATGTGVAIGANHSCLFDDGTVRCWGNDSYLQLGQGGVGPARTVVASVGSPFTGLIDTHGDSACGTTAADIQCWGNSSPVSVITEVAGASTIINSGILFDDGANNYKGSGCSLAPDKQLLCFGDNSIGQFGNGPVPATCGDAVCDPGDCELCPTDCTVVCTTCGDTLCNNGETAKSCPADCGSGPTLTATQRHYDAISVGWDLDNRGAPVCGVLAGGTVECWGRNVRGMITQELDLTGTMLLAYATTPRAIPNLASCTKIAVGVSHACALCNGEIKCWGDHRHGAVGSGEQTAFTVTMPRKIGLDPPGGEAWADLQAGAGYSCARTSGGRAFCWGANQHGALGLGASASTVPIVVRTE